MRGTWWEGDGPELAEDTVPWVPVLMVVGAVLCFGEACWLLGATV